MGPPIAYYTEVGGGGAGVTNAPPMGPREVTAVIDLTLPDARGDSHIVHEANMAQSAEPASAAAARRAFSLPASDNSSSADDMPSIAEVLATPHKDAQVSSLPLIPKLDV